MTALELVCLAALNGAEGVPSIDVKLNDESGAAEWRSIMDNQCRALERKGWLEMDFDGTARIHGTLRDFISAASESRSYYGLIHYADEQVTQRSCFFAQDNRFFEMNVEAGNDEYSILPLYGVHDFHARLVNRIDAAFVREAGKDEDSDKTYVIALFELDAKSGSRSKELTFATAKSGLWVTDSKQTAGDEMIPSTFEEVMDRLSLWVGQL